MAISVRITPNAPIGVTKAVTGVDLDEIAGMGRRIARGRAVEYSVERVVAEPSHAVVVAGRVIQWPDRREHGARGRIECIKNTRDAQRARGGIKSLLLRGARRQGAGEEERDRDQPNFARPRREAKVL